MRSELRPLTYQRVAHRLYCRGVPFIPALIEVALYVLCGARVPAAVSIGEGSILGHGGNGVVIHPKARIGRNVVIGQQVTIGATGKSGRVPVIEDDVFLGVGCKVLGDVTVGHNSVVGANAVVVRSVPARCVVGGVPARILREDVDAHDVETW
jgi:serine O-acetyltransferase